MQDSKDPKRAFLNRRDWGSYLRALQTAATYPKVMEAVNSGRAWFTEGATQASNWLASTAGLPEFRRARHATGCHTGGGPTVGVDDKFSMG
jgi:hypothetical protein